MEYVKNRLAAADVVIAAVLTAAAILTLLYPRFFSFVDEDIGLYAVVSTADEEFSLSLEENSSRTVTSNGVTLTLTVENGGIFVETSNCPDAVCVGTGRIKRPGAAIVCVPAKLSVRIESKSGGCEGEEADVLVG